jgi:hypothetical protein
VNCFIELTGQHGFKNDPEFGAVMKRIQEGCPAEANIAHASSMVIIKHAPSMAIFKCSNC